MKVELLEGLDDVVFKPSDGPATMGIGN